VDVGVVLQAQQEQLPEVEDDEQPPDDVAVTLPEMQAEPSDAVAAAAEAALHKPQPIVIRPKGVVRAPQRTPQTAQAAAEAAGGQPAPAHQSKNGSDNHSAAAAAAQQLMKEFAQPAPKRVVKVGLTRLSRCSCFE
jgi:hypothetical protein